MPSIGALTTWSTGNTLTAAALNGNFSTIKTAVNTYCLFKDATITVTAVHTYSAKPVYNAGITVANPLTLSGAASTIVPGATSLSLRNNADSADNLILTDAGAATFRSTVGGITTLTATTLAGTLSTAAQPNVTSLGTIAGLVTSGTTTLNGVAYTWPAADAAGLLKSNGAGTFSYDTSTFLTATTTRHYMVWNGSASYQNTALTASAFTTMAVPTGYTTSGGNDTLSWDAPEQILTIGTAGWYSIWYRVKIVSGSPTTMQLGLLVAGQSGIGKNWDALSDGPLAYQAHPTTGLYFHTMTYLGASATVKFQALTSTSGVTVYVDAYEVAMMAA